MRFITASGIYFDTNQNAQELVDKFPHDTEKIYEEAKRDVAYYGLTSPEYNLRDNLATLKLLQVEAAGIPSLEITISSGYDNWDQTLEKHGMFDIVFDSETVYSYATKGEILAYLSATRRCLNIPKGR